MKWCAGGGLLAYLRDGVAKELVAADREDEQYEAVEEEEMLQIVERGDDRVDEHRHAWMELRRLQDAEHPQA